MSVEIVLPSNSAKVWDRAGIKLVTLNQESAVRLARSSNRLAIFTKIKFLIKLKANSILKPIRF